MGNIGIRELSNSNTELSNSFKDKLIRELSNAIGELTNSIKIVIEELSH